MKKLMLRTFDEHVQWVEVECRELELDDWVLGDHYDTSGLEQRPEGA